MSETVSPPAGLPQPANAPISSRTPTTQIASAFAVIAGMCIGVAVFVPAYSLTTGTIYNQYSLISTPDGPFFLIGSLVITALSIGRYFTNHPAFSFTAGLLSACTVAGVQFESRSMAQTAGQILASTGTTFTFGSALIIIGSASVVALIASVVGCKPLIKLRKPQKKTIWILAAVAGVLAIAAVMGVLIYQREQAGEPSRAIAQWRGNGGTEMFVGVQHAYQALTTPGLSRDFPRMAQTCDNLLIALRRMQAYDPLPDSEAQKHWSKGLVQMADGSMDCSYGLRNLEADTIRRGTNEMDSGWGEIVIAGDRVDQLAKTGDGWR